MAFTIKETQYPISFRQDDALKLCQLIEHRQPAVLLGMKRVGINNFLRFFLYHPQIKATYFGSSKKHLFIHVDLYDLVEIDFYPFWMLTLKRIVDTARLTNLDKSTQKYLDSLFLDSIQSNNLFLLMENVRKALLKIVESDSIPTIFFNRFDRLFSVVNVEFFNNLKGLRETTHHQLSYIFTSYRNLDQLVPQAFPTTSWNAFCHPLYIQPASPQDIATIMDQELHRQNLKINSKLKEGILQLAGGHIQYLQLALVALHQDATQFKSLPNLFRYLTLDDQVNLQSEELWASLTPLEQTVLMKIVNHQVVTAKDLQEGQYLWDSGFIQTDQSNIFSPLFIDYLKHQPDTKSSSEFTDKENLLFNYLKNHNNEICEREAIIEGVWPEEVELGVSDWAIDRLIARVRNKISQQKLPWEIITIKTRGYKLIPA